jgi:hypothetical protein
MAGDKKYGGGGRKQFVRTRVPAVETISAAIILLLLLTIGIAIYQKGKHFDPNRYAVRADALKTTATAVAGKSGTVRVTETTPAIAPQSPAEAATTAEPNPPATSEAAAAEGGAEGAGTAPQPAGKGEPLEISLTGTKPMGDTEFYNADNLYEKIDGRAPAYQSFNVVGLRCRSFSVTAAPGSYVDVYEYRFDTPVDAFGMFSQERDPKGQPLDIVADGYAAEMGCFFRQGAVYVQIIASDTKPETLAKAKSIGDIRAKDLPVDDKGLAGRKKLPADGMMADSVAYVPENAQGQSALKEVFQAKYKFDGAEIPFFVMVATADEAAKAWQSFQDFCGKFGTIETLPEVNGGNIFRAQVFGKWKVVYQRAGELGGAFDAADGDAARAFIEKYLRGEIK